MHSSSLFVLSWTAILSLDAEIFSGRGDEAVALEGAFGAGGGEVLGSNMKTCPASGVERKNERSGAEKIYGTPSIIFQTVNRGLSFSNVDQTPHFAGQKAW